MLSNPMGMVEGADGVDIDVQCHKYPKLTRVTCTLLRAYRSFFAISILEIPSVEHILLIAPCRVNRHISSEICGPVTSPFKNGVTRIGPSESIV
jgi:hypothetical protein